MINKNIIKIIIPARLNSSRFPRKILAKIHGKTLMQHTYEQALRSNLGDVFLAVDSEEVACIAKDFGAKNILMTSNKHISGTSRISEAVKNLNLDPNEIILNWQVDEPLLPINNAQQVVNLLIENLNKINKAEIATLCEPIELLDDLRNPNITKVVLNHSGNALYFSRAMIPWERGYFPEKLNSHTPGVHLRHIGLYAYRANFLLEFNSMPDCPMEIMEGLEQLRFLYAGYSIQVAKAQDPSLPGVDTPEDLIKVEGRLLLS